MFVRTKLSRTSREPTAWYLHLFFAILAAAVSGLCSPCLSDTPSDITIDSTTDFPDTNDLSGPYWISTHVVSPDGIAGVYLYRRIGEDTTYYADEMFHEGSGVYRLGLEGLGRGGGPVSYFIHAVDSVFSVKRDPENAPLETYDFRIFYVPDFFPADSVSGIESFYTGVGFSHQWADVDGDRDPDLYLALPSQDEPNRFYRNDGSGVFTDVSAISGASLPGRESVGTAFGDFDNDGLEDLAVTVSISHPFLFRNTGEWTFEDVSLMAGLTDGLLAPTSVLWTDADIDGYLDLLITAEDGVFLYRNTGGSSFVNETELRGLPFDDSSFRSAVAFDADGDGDSELLFLGEQSWFYSNDAGWFNDVSSQSGLTASASGASVLDVDADGDLDVIMCGESVMLLENDGTGAFEDVSDEYGVSGIEWNGPGVGDINADSRTDLSFSTGDLFVLEANGSFMDVTPYNDIDRVVSFADANGDGRIDLFTFMNLLRLGAGFPGGIENRWLEVDLVGTLSNRSAVGAVAVLYAGDLVATGAVSGAPPNARTLHFGFEEEEPDSLVIRWPSGIRQVESNLQYNTLIGIEEDSTLVAIDDDITRGKTPVPFALYQNYPNPFNPHTLITFDLPGDKGQIRHVNVTVYDLRGKKVRELVNTLLEPGRHRVTWDGKDHLGRPAGSGVYLYMLRSGGLSVVKKMVIQK